MSVIRQFREERKITQKDLAERLNVAQSTVAMWETGNRKPDIVTIKRLSEIFECTADDLLKDIEEKEV